MGSGDSDQPKRKGRFPETQWELIHAAAQDGDEALEAFEELCRIYWYPLYGFVRDRGYSHHDAQDHTQALFENLVPRKHVLSNARPERGRFRTYILTALKNQISKRNSHANTIQRGGKSTRISFDSTLANQLYAQELATNESPEKIYERRWAQALLERVKSLLAAEYAKKQKMHLFERLYDQIPLNNRERPYEEIAAELEIEIGSARVEVYRMRKRFRVLLREEICRTVGDVDDIDAEINYLFDTFNL